MSLRFWRILLFVVLSFALILAGAGALRAQPEKPATPDLQPRESEVQGWVELPAVERAQASPQATILTEGFEAVWPAGLWTRQDASSSDGGEYLWEDRTCTPRTGGWSGYSVGGGANGSQLPCTGPYPNLLNTWTFWGPFDLTNATAASFTFHYRGTLESHDTCAYDRFLAVHVDDNGDYNGRQFCGPWEQGTTGNNYYTWTVDMASRLGDPTVWIAFALQTDGSQTFAGMLIDDVRVDVTLAATCYQLTLDKTGQGGIPTATPAASPGCASGRYTAGQAITLTASPASGWRVGSWQGTNNNSSTANTNTVTMPASTHTARVNYVQQTTGPRRAALPFILYGLTGFLGPLESEPNNNTAEANGPILFNRNYQGFPNDLSDYFYFELNTRRQVTITLNDITGRDPQLQLRDAANNLVGNIDATPPYSLSRTLDPGRYYVRIVVVANNNSSVLYTLRVQ